MAARKMHGFTLVELIIVITILGILATLGIAAFVKANKSPQAQHKGPLPTRQVPIIHLEKVVIPRASGVDINNCQLICPAPNKKGQIRVYQVPAGAINYNQITPLPQKDYLPPPANQPGEVDLKF